MSLVRLVPVSDRPVNVRSCLPSEMVSDASALARKLSAVVALASRMFAPSKVALSANDWIDFNNDWYSSLYDVLIAAVALGSAAAVAFASVRPDVGNLGASGQ